MSDSPVRLKPSEFPVGAWFAVPLPFGEKYALGVILAKFRGSRMEAAFFGPYDELPTVEDACRLSPDDAAHVLPDRRTVKTNVRSLRDGTFPLLPLDGVPDASGWFELMAEADGRYYSGIRWRLTQQMIPELIRVTDPVALSSWYCSEFEEAAGWVASISERGELAVLESVFDRCDEGPEVPVDLSVIGFTAVELAARTYTVGRHHRGRIDELPKIDHQGCSVTAFHAAQWISQVAEVDICDAARMADLAARAERSLDGLLERSVWVVELRDGPAEGWEAFTERVEALTAWLRSEWVRPRTLAEILDGAMGALESELAEEADESGFVPRPIPAGVDPVARRGAVWWFGRDDVSDWVAGALSADGDAAVTSAMEAAIASGEGDVMTIGVALAAADVVSRRVSDGAEVADVSHPVERSVIEFVVARIDAVIDRNDVERARRVVVLARTGELAREIDELDDEVRAAWLSLLDELDERLSNS